MFSNKVPSKSRGIQKKTVSLGVGLLLLLEDIELILSSQPKVDWFEVLTEEVMDVSRGAHKKSAINSIKQISEIYPIVLHGTQLSIGSTDQLDFNYLTKLKKLIREFAPRGVTDHLCWTGVDGIKTHELLPVPYTEEALSHISARVAQVQDYLGVRIALENPPSYITYAESEMSDAEFFSELAKKADCNFLIDISNLYVSSQNNGFDPFHFLKSIPSERVQQFHLAGYLKDSQFLLDTHSTFIADPVWDLYRFAIQTHGRVSTNIEWDMNVPNLRTLLLEANKAREIYEEASKKIAV